MNSRWNETINFNPEYSENKTNKKYKIFEGLEEIKEINSFSQKKQI
jgi:hypothetical protein